MAFVQVIAGNTRCILCDAKYKDCETFNLINSPRGRDLQALFSDLLGVKPTNGVICRRTCRVKLENVEKTLAKYKAAIEKNTQVTDITQNQV